MTKNGMKTENRLSTLEANYKSLEDKVDEITNNHLVHLSEDIKELHKSINGINVRLAMWSGAIMVGVFLLDKLFK